MTQLSHNRIYNIVAHYAEITGVHVSPHGFRHARATHIANVEIWPITYVQRMLGHTSLATTQKYVHANDDMVRDCMMKKYNNQ